MKKTITTVLATLGVLASVSMPVMANAATVSHANTLITSAASSYTVNPFSVTPLASGSNAWGTDTFTNDLATDSFDWSVSPANTSISYTYNLIVDVYTTANSYVGSENVPTTSGAGNLSGSVPYPSLSLATGTYLAKLSGTWTGSDGSSGAVGTVGPITYRWGY